MGKKNYGSVFGFAKRSTYKYFNDLLETNKNAKVLVIDGLDGGYVLPFLRKGFNVTCYETNSLMLNGGIKNGKEIIGLKEKIRFFGFEDKCTIIEKNFYKEQVKEKYDFIFIYQTMHLNRNKDVSLEDKIKKIISCLNINGEVYIKYFLAITEFDYYTYNKNQYFRRNQILKFFDESIDLIDIIENNNIDTDKPHLYNDKVHNHRVGSINFRKIVKVFKYTYKLNCIKQFNVH